MSRRVPYVAAGTLLAALAGPWVLAQQAAPPQGQRPVFRGGANVVLVDVYPTVDGKIVEGLERTDFQVFENGQPQSIDQFEFVRVEPGVEGDRRDPNSVAESMAQAADPRNRVFVIFLDHLHVNVGGSHAARRPLVDLLERVMAPNDLFGVTTTHFRPKDIVFARRTESLEKQLADNWAWGLRQGIAREPDEQWMVGCVNAVDQGQGRTTEGGIQRRLSDVLVARMREDKVLTHLEGLIEYLGAVREARKSVIAFTNGWLLYGPDRALAEGLLGGAGPRRPQVGVGGGGQMVIGSPIVNGRDADCNIEIQRLLLLDNGQRMRDLINRANRNNVSFYPVNPSGIEVFDVSLSEQVLGGATASADANMQRITFRTDTMRTLAENTDGLTVITNDLTAGLRRIVDDMSAYYLLGYSSTNAKPDGNYRRIEVKTTRPGVRVRARRGYVAAKELPLPPSGTAAAGSAVPAPLTEALGVLSRLRPDADLFTRATVDGTTMSVVVELAAARLSEARFAQGAEVAVTVTDRAGAAASSAIGRIEAGRRAVVVPVTLPDVTSGPWRVAVRIGGATAIEDRVESRISAGVLLSEPQLFRAAPGGTAPLRPVADFQFYRTERVHLEWVLKKPIDRREARLLNRSGQPLAVPVSVTERANDGGKATLAADLVLSPLANGDYVIEATVGGGTDTERVYVPLRIVR